MRRPVLQLLAYLGLACVFLQPAADSVPGGSRTDVWNSLWSMWFAHRSLADGALPWHTQLLNFPDGGTVLLPDLFGAAFAGVAVPVLGVAGAYTVLLLLRLALAGLVAHRFCAAWLRHGGMDSDAADRAGWVAGIGYSTAPVLLAGVQCATTEAVNGAWPALAAWMCWRTAVDANRRNVLYAIGALLGATIASWYAAVMAFVLGGAILALTPRSPSSGGSDRLKTLGYALALALPYVAFTHWIHSDPHHLGTRSPEILHVIRNSFGAADLADWVLPIANADIATLNSAERGQGYLHTNYLGGALLLAALISLWRKVPGHRGLVLGGAICALLALGPTLHVNGQAIGSWMPYALLESLPGLGSLSLLWRLGAGTALVVALLAAAATQGRLRWVVGLAILVLLELSQVSPLSSGIAHTPTLAPPAMSVLRDAPKGAVLTLPVTQSHRELWWQTVHLQPVVGSINRHRNKSANVWLEKARSLPMPSLAQAAQDQGVRYLVIHGGHTLRHNPNRPIAQTVTEALSPLSKDGQLTIYRLW